MTIKKKIEVLKAIENNLLAMSNIFEKDGNNELHEKYFDRYMTMQDAIAILTDNAYCKDIAKIFDIEV